MTRTEHLERIKNMCLLCLENCKDNGIDRWTDPSIAGWKSTIAAIERHQKYSCAATESIMDSIISAWPEELL